MAAKKTKWDAVKPAKTAPEATGTIEEKPVTPTANEQESKDANIPAGDIGQTDDAEQQDDRTSIEATGANEAKGYTTQKPDEKPLILLVPYLKSEAAGEELKYALRTWDKNFDKKIRVLIVGDCEDWFADEVEHLPVEIHLIDEECGCDNPKKIKDAQSDVAHKIFTAIAAGAVDGDFILTWDDVFLLGPTTLHDIIQPRTEGGFQTAGKSGGRYNMNARRTEKLLKSLGLPTVKYDTHTPVLMDAERTAAIIGKYRAMEQGLLIKSLYFNTYDPEPRGLLTIKGGAGGTILLSVYSENPPLGIVETALRRRKYLNCNSKGWRAIKHLFETAYPDKSRFEK